MPRQKRLTMPGYVWSCDAAVPEVKVNVWQYKESIRKETLDDAYNS